jgi:signal transduction histidine kinase
MGREYSRGQLDLATLLAPADVEKLKQTVRRVAATREGARFELAMQLGGDEHVFEQRVDARREGVTMIGFDISSLKHAEHKLRDADVRKDEFLATLSHELRNPLAALSIAIDVARMGTAEPEDLRECLDVMQRQMTMLSSLVDELLDLSHITHGKLTLDTQVIELARVLEQALETVRTSIDDSAQELHVELPISSIRVSGDRMRLVQVFSNLLSNATKFTPELGRIEVTTAVDRDRRVVEVRIADNGKGLAAEELDHIFEIFVQSRDADGRARGGLGIGLNVVRRLVELHGGTAVASSAGPGKGAAFTIELPLAR